MLSGVPAYEYPALKQEDIMAELEKKYPDFEKRTGWRLDSEYKETMPEDLEKEVKEKDRCLSLVARQCLVFCSISKLESAPFVLETNRGIMMIFAYFASKPLLKV